MKISNFKFQISNFDKGFTLIELIVVIAIIGLLSMVVMFSVVQYVNRSRDANIIGNLAILVSAGEVFYNSNQSYNGFCDSSVVENAESQMPKLNINSYACVEASDNDSWAAYNQLFSDDNYAYCVDSRGVKRRINWSAVGQINANSARCP